jgi:hypothetical protein
MPRDAPVTSAVRPPSSGVMVMTDVPCAVRKVEAAF